MNSTPEPSSLPRHLLDLVDTVEAVMKDEQVRRFVRQSNAIEGIEDDQDEVHLRALRRFLDLKKVTVIEITAFAKTVQPGVKLRDRRGRDVFTRRQDGSVHTYPAGSRQMVGRLEELLEAVGRADLEPAEAHAAFEALHPFTDGNGRAGRALWAWQMRRAGLDPFSLSFLQRWYYQSLELARRASSAP